MNEASNEKQQIREEIHRLREADEKRLAVERDRVAEEDRKIANMSLPSHEPPEKALVPVKPKTKKKQVVRTSSRDERELAELRIQNKKLLGYLSLPECLWIFL